MVIKKNKEKEEFIFFNLFDNKIKMFLHDQILKQNNLL